MIFLKYNKIMKTLIDIQFLILLILLFLKAAFFAILKIVVQLRTPVSFNNNPQLQTIAAAYSDIPQW